MPSEITVPVRLPSSLALAWLLFKTGLWLILFAVVALVGTMGLVLAFAWLTRHGGAGGFTLDQIVKGGVITGCALVAGAFLWMLLAPCFTP